MLRHENLSQTSTYLNATRVGLQDSMRRFDGERCKAFAKRTEIEHSPLCNVETNNEAKSLIN